MLLLHANTSKEEIKFFYFFFSIIDVRKLITSVGGGTMHYSDNEIMLIMISLIKIFKTKAALAKKLKISPQLFNYWFNHAKKVSIESIVKMAELLKIEMKNS